MRTIFIFTTITKQVLQPTNIILVATTVPIRVLSM